MFCLRAPTDPAWAREAVGNLDSVLVDHAHCEMKAATNAMSLVVRHPSDFGLVRALTQLAREELDHFDRAVAFLEARGLALGAPPVDDYAAALRRAMNALAVPSFALDGSGGKNGAHLASDRLLVGALIEARSCERFKLLLEALDAAASGGEEAASAALRAFYEELFAAEARHYRTYVDLAKAATRAVWAGASESEIDAHVEARLRALAEAEARIVVALAAKGDRATVHG